MSALAQLKNGRALAPEKLGQGRGGRSGQVRALPLPQKGFEGRGDPPGRAYSLRREETWIG